MNSHKVAISNLEKLYWPLLKANWQYLSLAVFLNMYYVPPMVTISTTSSTIISIYLSIYYYSRII